METKHRFKIGDTVYYKDRIYVILDCIYGDNMPYYLLRGCYFVIPENEVSEAQVKPGEEVWIYF